MAAAVTDSGGGQWILPRVGFAGLPVTSLPVTRERRPEGSSAYTSWKRLRVGVLSFADGLARRQADTRSAPVFLVAAFVLATVLHAVADSGAPFGIGDEGFRYLLSRSYARGEVLHERYQVLYPTGQYVWLGTVMRLFGEELAVYRWGCALLGGLGGSGSLRSAPPALGRPGLGAGRGARRHHPGVAKDTGVAPRRSGRARPCGP